jgi:hypothetical protein
MKSLAEVIIEPILKDAEGSAVDLDFDDPDPGWEQDHHDDVDEDYVENGDEDDDEIDEDEDDDEIDEDEDEDEWP